MWLQNLLFLGTVVCSISAPTSLPRPVTRPSRHVDAIQEALSLLNKSSDETAVMNESVKVVSGMFDRQEPTCLQTRLQLYSEGLRGSLISLKQPLNLMADHYKEHCLETPPTKSPKNCTTEESNFSQFKEALQSVVISIEGWKSCKTIK
uniref:Granulocyte-macrophage colony-stimulating factor n=1 Tax=Mustela putorius furo TaxID=9669 RepID=M3YJD6_MUSPF